MYKLINHKFYGRAFPGKKPSARTKAWEHMKHDERLCEQRPTASQSQLHHTRFPNTHMRWLLRPTATYLQPKIILALSPTAHSITSTPQHLF